MILILSFTDMGTTHFFIRFDLVSKSFYSIKLMTHSDFTGNDSNQLTTQNGSLKFDSQEASRILIQINSRLKKLEFWFKLTHDWKNYLEYWFESTHYSMTSLSVYFWLRMTFLEHSTQLLTSFDLFWAFEWNDFPRNWFESAHGSNSISELWIDSTHVSGFQDWTQNRPMTQVDSLGIDSDRLMAQMPPHFST